MSTSLKTHRFAACLIPPIWFMTLQLVCGPILWKYYTLIGGIWFIQTHVINHTHTYGLGRP